MDDYIHLKIQDIYMTLRTSKKKGSAHNYPICKSHVLYGI